MFVAISAMFIFSCKKDPGPKGDTGATGNQGATGITNVISYSFSTSAVSWTLNSPIWGCIVFPSQLSSTIADGGMVVGYIQIVGEWNPLPKVTFLPNNVQQKYQFSFKANEIDLSFLNADWTEPPNPGAQNFRFVFIPPGMIKPYLNYSNFNEIRSYYDLKD